MVPESLGLILFTSRKISNLVQIVAILGYIADPQADQRVCLKPNLGLEYG